MELQKFEALDLQKGVFYKVTYFSGKDTQRNISGFFDGVTSSNKAIFNEDNCMNDFYLIPIKRITKIV